MPIPEQDPMPDLIQFLRKWWRIGKESGIAASVIPSFAPEPLRTLYGAIGNWPVDFKQQWREPEWRTSVLQENNRLLPPDQLQRVDNRVVFASENQHLWEAETAANGDDPPVEVVYERGQGSEERVGAADRLSHFLTTFCLNEVLHGRKGNRFSHLCSESRLRKFLASDWERLWSAPMLADPRWRHSFYAIDCSALFLHIWSPDETNHWWWCNLKSRGHAVFPSVHRLANI